MFEVTALFAHESQNDFYFSPQTYPGPVLLLNQTSKTESGKNARLEIAKKIAALAADRNLNTEASIRQLYSNDFRYSRTYFAPLDATSRAN